MRGGADVRGSKVRVLWLIKGLGPGGAEQLLVSSAQVADRDRVDLEIAFVRPDKTHLVDRLETLGVPCRLLGAPPRGSVAWPSRLRALLASGTYDVVHMHSPVLAGATRLAALSIPASRRPAVVTTEHSAWVSHSRPTRLLNGVTASLDQHRWAVSDEVRDSMRTGAGRKTDVLINGIALQQFQPSPGARSRIRAEFGIPNEAVIACTIANLRRQKDYPNLLRAARLAGQQDKDLFVVAVGQGPLEEDLRRLHTDLGLGARVQLLGYRTDTADILAASDFFVLASAHEGLPVALMEAMSMGLPIVATTVGGVPSMITPGVEGLLVPPGDSAALAKAMVDMAASAKLRSEMGTASKAASGQYDISRAVECQTEVYETLAAERRSRE